MSSIYATWTVGTEDLKLVLSTGEIERLERSYGSGSLMNPLLMAQNGQLPSLSYMLDVIHGALQKFNSGYTRTDTADLYDKWIEENDGSQTELLKLVMEVFKASGFFPKGKTKAKKPALNVVK